jgi:hypothetical protein
VCARDRIGVLTISQRDTKYKCFSLKAARTFGRVVATRPQPRLKIEPRHCYDEGSA